MTTRIEWDNKIPRSHEVFDQLLWPRVFPISLSVRCALCTSLPYFEWAPSKHLRSLHPLTHATTLKHTRAFESHVAYAQVLYLDHKSRHIKSTARAYSSYALIHGPNANDLFKQIKKQRSRLEETHSLQIYMYIETSAKLSNVSDIRDRRL